MSSAENPILKLAELESPSVIMIVGIPGSGKSHIASELGIILNMPVISSDACREELSGDANDQSVSHQAWELVYTKAHAAIDASQSVIIDGTHAASEERRTDAARYRSFGANTVVAVHVIMQLESVLARNTPRDRTVPKHVIEHMHYMLAEHPPIEDDGFDFVINLKND